MPKPAYKYKVKIVLGDGESYENDIYCADNLYGLEDMINFDYPDNESYEIIEQVPNDNEEEYERD